jgi:hypothetical protein
VVALVESEGAYYLQVPLTEIVLRKKSVLVASRNRFPLTKICTERNGNNVSAEYEIGVASNERNSDGVDELDRSMNGRVVMT